MLASRLRVAASSRGFRSFVSWEATCAWMAAHPESTLPMAAGAVIIPAITVAWQQRRVQNELQRGISAAEARVGELHLQLKEAFSKAEAQWMREQEITERSHLQAEAQSKREQEITVQAKELQRGKGEAEARAVQLDLELKEASVTAEEQSKRGKDITARADKMEEGKGAAELRAGELQSSLSALQSKAAGLEKSEGELRLSRIAAEEKLAAAEEKLAAAMVREARLHSSISHRGQQGELGLEKLLEEAKRSRCIVSYKLQAGLKGQIPDAIVELAGGRCLVVDSKAPTPPTGRVAPLS